MTTETVRRDLSALERIGLIRRVHGGAVPASSLAVIESGLTERDLANTAAKDLIAAAAVALLPPPGSIIIIDAGSTTARLAALLPRDHRLTVVTHAVPVAARLAGLPQIDLFLLPGKVRPTTQAAVGADTVAALGDLRADVSFVATNGLSIGHGLTTPDREEAATKRAIVAAGRRTVVPCRLHQDRRRVLAAVRLHQRHRRPGHRLSHQARRPEGPRRGRRGSGDRMILTLTPNPSIDRTVSLAGELMRGQVQRVDAVTSQGGGKGVNISRASVSAGQPTIAVLPGRQGRPLRHRAAGRRHRLPAGPARRRRPRQHRHHRARRHDHQAQLPGRHRRAGPPGRMSDALIARAGSADWVVLAGSLPPGAPAGVLRRRRTPPARHRRQGRRGHQRGPAAGARRRPPRVGAAPDEAERRGAGVLHGRRRRGPRGRPAAGRGRRPHARRPRRAGRPGDAGRQRRRARHRARAPGTPLPHRPPS